MHREFDLYGDRTGNCLRTAIALEESDHSYEAHHVSLWNGAQRRAEFLALNPFGQVPVLVDRRGTSPIVLAQSNAIMMYVADSAPDRLLPLASDADRAGFLERFFYFVTDVIAPKHAAMHLMAAGSNRGHEAFLRRAASNLELAEGFLGDGLFMLGGGFSIVDILAVTAASTLEQVIDWEKAPRLRDWFELVSSRPAVTRGMRAFRAGPEPQA